MTTLAHDAALPALPLPELKASRDFALELIAPLVAPAELAASRRALDEFIRPGGDGEKLQAALKAHKDSLPGNSSWLRPFWDDMYTAWREMLPVHLNYIFCLEAGRWGGQDPQAALPRLLRALALLFRRIGLSDLAPEEARQGWLAMEQSQSCVYTRLPLQGGDTLRLLPLGGPLHAAITRRGHWFILPLCDAAGRLAPEEALLAALAEIRREGDALPPARPVSAFTAARREEAAQARAALLTSPLNRQSLAAIESAVLVLCLDEAHGSEGELARRLLCGSASRRWYDKSLQLVATDNGGLGANFEHSGCDAAIWLYLFGLADAMIAEMPPGGEPEEGGAFKARPRRLDWDIDAGTAARLQELERDFAVQAGKVELHAQSFPEYSRQAVKALGASPDAFLQLSFQVAQYREFGRLRSSYEAVAVRSFAQGRTEVCRACTAEAAAFAAALEAGAGQEELLALYRLAERAHGSRLARAQAGQGAERHFYGLEHIYAMRGAALGLGQPPALFSDKGWRILKRDSLSTSGIGAPFIRYFGFGPVVEDGLGLGYAPSAAFTNLIVSGYHGKSPDVCAFAAAFARAAGEIAAVLKQ